MKCVQNIFDGKISRVSNEIADIMVTKGTHQFVSKSIWKNVKDLNNINEDESITEVNEVVPKKKKNKKKNKKFNG
jgi:hypothetical protein